MVISEGKNKITDISIKTMPLSHSRETSNGKMEYYGIKPLYHYVHHHPFTFSSLHHYSVNEMFQT